MFDSRLAMANLEETQFLLAQQKSRKVISQSTALPTLGSGYRSRWVPDPSSSESVPGIGLDPGRFEKLAVVSIVFELVCWRLLICRLAMHGYYNHLQNRLGAPSVRVDENSEKFLPIGYRLPQSESSR
jgi:hypothetical protein